MAVAQDVDTTPPSSPTRLVFVHHSTGGYWLADDYGTLGKKLMDNNYYVSATNYGWGPNVYGGAIGSSTDIGNWYTWWRDEDAPASSVIDALMSESGQNIGDYGPWSRMSTKPAGENVVIVFKSCFPNSGFKDASYSTIPPIQDNPLRGKSAGDSAHTVPNAKGIYLDLLGEFKKAPNDKLYIIVAAPPLQLSDTSTTQAARAREFNNWLIDPNGFLADYPYKNVAVFDYYNVLTGPDAHHRVYNGRIQHIAGTQDYSYYPSGDSHPSQDGDVKATTEFVPLLNAYYNMWRQSASESIDHGSDNNDNSAMSDVITKAMIALAVALALWI